MNQTLNFGGNNNNQNFVTDNIIGNNNNNNNTVSDGYYGNRSLASNSTGLPYDDSPYNVKQAILIFRLILLGLGLIGNSLLIFVYIKCSSIITNRLGVYVVNLCIAFVIDMLDATIWSLKQFGYDYKDPQWALPHLVHQLAGLPQIGLPTTSLFFFLMLFDRLWATCAARCYRSCYGSLANACVLSVLLWLASFFMIFIIIFPDLLFPYEELHTVIRFLVSYIGPFALKLLLAIILIAKRKMVPDNDQSQAFIDRQRKSLYYTLTIVIIHLLFSVPYYVLQTNIYFKLVDAIQVDEWIVFLCYTVSEVPLVLNPIFCFSIEPEFKDSLVSVCTCAGRQRRDRLDGGDDHAECQPLAPLATSPIAEEKEHLDEAEN
ncbi:uncharacterized protein LOC128961066 [Oppia nitens]|uniref:uncharacterized protein LOC128961066 n=1 Tax=Oppia nitens TaxID=1686743 RepID=UPI0023DC929B|nr:uncharacterized protein LOC128961066 [Oppia nitens]